MGGAAGSGRSLEEPVILASGVGWGGSMWLQKSAGVGGESASLQLASLAELGDNKEI